MKTLIAIVALAALPLWAAAQPIGMRESDGVRWVCGGVGEEERESLAAFRPEANLSLLFVAGKRGAYLADVAVSLYAAGSKTPRLEFRADGPMCLLRAAPGRYRIEASLNGVKRAADAEVTRGAKQPARAVFVFPEQE